MWYILKFAGKLDGTRKRKHSEKGNPDPERQTWYACTHKWILDINQSITMLQSIVPEKLGKRETLRGTHMEEPRKNS